MTLLAALTLLLWLLLTADWLVGVLSTGRLESPPSTPELERYPRVSIIIPALNEAHTIEAALTSVLAQDYPNFEIIALNDRSSDPTGTVLDRMKMQYPNLQVVHITELPTGWLGKNHALNKGAGRATGEYLLFTDADVRFAPDALRSAMNYALEHDLEHLTAIPHLYGKTPLLRSFIAAFTLLFSYSVLRASGRLTDNHVGLGAFNLLRRSVYRQVGGHETIALRPDDDMRLGRLVKRAGFRQRVVFAADLIQVEWYESVGGGVRGLNKNAFAGLYYSLPLVLLVTGTLLVTHVWPFAAVFVTTGTARSLYALVLLTILFVYIVGSRFTRLPWPFAALHPVGTAILVYAILEAAFKATVQGGIRWRGTFYGLGELKKNKG